MSPETSSQTRQPAPAGATHKVREARAGDRAGRALMVEDPTAAHQITVKSASGHTACLIGCTCTTASRRIPYSAPDAATWDAYASLDHRSPSPTETETTL